MALKVIWHNATITSKQAWVCNSTSSEEVCACVFLFSMCGLDWLLYTEGCACVLFSLHFTPSFSWRNGCSYKFFSGGKERAEAKSHTHKTMDCPCAGSNYVYLKVGLLRSKSLGLFPVGVLGCLPLLEHQTCIICHWCFAKATEPWIFLARVHSLELHASWITLWVKQVSTHVR